MFWQDYYFSKPSRQDVIEDWWDGQLYDSTGQPFSYEELLRLLSSLY